MSTDNSIMMAQKIQMIKDFIQVYHKCPKKLDLDIVATECYNIAHWHEKRKCPRKVGNFGLGGITCTTPNCDLLLGDKDIIKEEPTELDNDLEERLLSIENMLELGRLALTSDNHELISTALESAFEKLQYVVDDYCVKANIVERETIEATGNWNLRPFSYGE